jgi:hypothetical protein
MAVLNILTAANCVGKTYTTSLSSSTVTMLTNATNSNQLIKLNTIMVSNFSSNVVSTNVIYNRNTVLTYLAGNVVIPANSTLVVLGKDTPLYIEENDSIQSSCNVGSATSFTCSYELIS